MPVITEEEEDNRSYSETGMDEILSDIDGKLCLGSIKV